MDVKKIDNKKPVGIVLAVAVATLFAGCAHYHQSPTPYQVSTIPQTTYHGCHGKNGCPSPS